MDSRRAALVTGGRRGIGRGIALALAEAGFDVAVNDVEHDADADSTLAAIAERGGRGIFIAADIARVDDHAALVGRVYEAFGRLDCLVNNAGVMCVRGDILEAEPDDFDRVLGINLKGTFFLTQEAARRMIAEDRARAGRSIVTITSANSQMVSQEKSAYCLSKSALSMMVRMFAVRLAEHGIAAFEVRPGFIRSDMSRPAWERFTGMIEAGETPIRRWGTPEDVGRAVASLATGALPYATGQAVNVDGGLLIHRL